MPVPFEALIPLGLITAMFTITGSLLNLSRRHSNDGKPPRFSMDKWDKQMMERDKRLTGSPSRQSAEPVAPQGFATSSIYYLTNKTL
ncbi:14908_t:CDS:2 [Funneliformis caledonium]|uniref:NADH dehydrogenase [ubiquinone] 1 alpha subcomplex subunit 1 n=2 Tax=Funneliformis TaxID=1117308 RepID=A0A9N9CAX0_9GLOM|nr:7213_t:CDS:2 [Funneliformis mosseae]CAG8593733.1 14908_t:CDS:2 [Funneliformis caledonium]